MPDAPSPRAVPALSRRRANAAQRWRDPRRLRRAVARHRPAHPDAGGAGGRGVLVARLPGCAGGFGHRNRAADVIGGGSRSRSWIAIIAAVLGLPLHRLADGEHGGAFGAARLARMAVTGEDPALVCAAPVG